MGPCWNVKRLIWGILSCRLRSVSCLFGRNQSTMGYGRNSNGYCIASRSRSLLLIAVLFIGGLLLLLYIQPMTSVTIIQAGSQVIAQEQGYILTKQRTNSIADGDITRESVNLSVQWKTHSHAFESQHNSSVTNRSSNDRNKQPEKGISFENSHTPQKCTKKWNVSFLKVHKAGSTTVMNIFLRFAIQNHLNIVLPRKSEGFGFNYLGYGTTVTRENIVPLPGNETYNILCNHVVYNKSAFRSIMPFDTVYVGILRDPKSHFLSAGTYYGLFGRLQNYAKEHNFTSNTSVISDFLKYPSKYPVGTFYEHNRMAFDLGVPKHKFKDAEFLYRHINELNEDYSLMMIMERFEESLIFLKRALCWDTKDILYVPLNARRNKRDFNLSQTDTNNLRRWNSADFKLYDYFKKVFEKLVLAAGSDFQQEVQYFRKTRTRVEQYCKLLLSSKNSPPIPSIIEFEATKWSESFTIDITDCKLMSEYELPIMKRLINAAWKRYNDWTYSQESHIFTEKTINARDGSH